MFAKSKLYLKDYSVSTVQDYIALPKSEREYKGLYLVPRALAVKYLGNPGSFSEWDLFYSYVRQNYPIQWFFRHYLTSWDNPVYKFVKLKVMHFQDFKHATKRFFKPLCPRWRNSFRRHEYLDISSIIEKSNFALILDFWYEDVENGFTDWNSTPALKKFYKELQKAVKYIENDRKIIEQQIDDALSESVKNRKAKSFTTRYKKLTKLEEKLKDSDTHVLTWLITNRYFFWD